MQAALAGPLQSAASALSKPGLASDSRPPPEQIKVYDCREGQMQGASSDLPSASHFATVLFEADPALV
jgi:hypothetical protein